MKLVTTIPERQAPGLCSGGLLLPEGVLRCCGRPAPSGREARASETPARKLAAGHCPVAPELRHSRRQFLSALGKSAVMVGVAGFSGPARGADVAAVQTKRALLEVLRAVGKPARVFTNPDGTQLVLLPYGGRVLGLYAPGSEENFYWTHGALGAAETARAFYASSDWHNSGGDRTWLAPEVDLFFPDFPNRDRYFQQRALDPGDYRVVEKNGSFKLVNRLTVSLSRAKEDVTLRITKTFGPAPNPMRHERGLDLSDLKYAGYTQSTALELVGRSRKVPARIGLWNLVQMPHGGDLLIPTYARTAPLRVFGEIPDEDLLISERLVRYRMRQQGEHKISLRAVATCGRVGYVYAGASDWCLIVRNFHVNPSGEYVDVPWNDTEDFGYSTQACNVNSGLGQFSELEYHIPAIGRGTGRTRCDDEAQVWAYRGSRSQIERVCRLLVG